MDIGKRIVQATLEVGKELTFEEKEERYQAMVEMGILETEKESVLSGK